MNVDVKNAQVGKRIHQIAAYNVCKELEEGTSEIHLKAKKNFNKMDQNEVKKLMVELGTTYQFATPHTSFIALEEREEIVDGSMTKQLIPFSQKPKQSTNQTSHKQDLKSYSRKDKSTVSKEKSKKMSSKSGGGGGGGGFFKKKSISSRSESSSNQPKFFSNPPKPSTSSAPPPPSRNSSFAPPIPTQSESFQSFAPSLSLSMEEECEEFEDVKSSYIEEKSETNSFSKKKISSESKKIPMVSKSNSVSKPSSSIFSSSSSSSSSSSKEGVEKIVMMQDSSGAWTLSNASSLINISLSVLKEKNPASFNSKSDELWATALVVAYLRLKHSSSQDLWGLVETKAKRFIKKSQLKTDMKDVDFLSVAENFLKSN